MFVEIYFLMDLNFLKIYFVYIMSYYNPTNNDTTVEEMILYEKINQKYIE